MDTTVDTPGLVVVGASLAGLRAVQSARRSGYEGPITLVGAEAHLPYDRPPLSKAYLGDQGEPDYFVTEEELADLNVTLRLGQTATGLDTSRKLVLLGDERLPYARLIIATGAHPRTLPSLPILPGVVTLRTLDDAQDLRTRLTPDTNVVVIGAGFIGAEIASSASGRGANVTVLEAAPVPLVRAVGDVVGAAISTLHARHGVRMVCEARIVGLVGETHVTGVTLDTGETIPADVVVVGIGAAPATEWLRESGLELHERDGGIVCDEFLRTSDEDVFAAGDAVHWPNGALDATMRLENWTNAADQGTRAGANAVAPREQQRPYETVPYFWSDWYGHRIQFVGGAADADDVVFASGEPEGDQFVALFRRGERVIGVATLNEPRKIMKFRRLISKRGTWEDAQELLGSFAAAPDTSVPAI
ncbi:FAD-dependent oxidoreductase [Microbacterium aquimaris]|uniref:NAD(P)/FAD-dependent oxidoreductase n=1 Tax=Microbacterium aquimaris TaxID=459816 RepID=UPI002AD566A1|nr:FAD-dependent oxidoreductase [Microbacterium aquimaris]MDZ8275052.1 FAD-dependent oxidoreductase [Microbacterium aquimaris]